MRHPAAHALLALLVAIAASGCAVRETAAPDRLSLTATAPRINWPARDAPTVFPCLAPDGSVRDLWLIGVEGGNAWPITTLLAPVQARVLRVMPRGRGVLADVRGADPDAAKRNARSLWFYSSATPTLPAGLLARTGAAGPHRAEPVGPVEFELVEPLALPPARGLVLYLASIGALEYEQRIITEMRRRGWAVVATVLPWGLTFETPRPDAAGASPEVFGAWAAERLDERLSEWAYGFEAVMEDLAESRPELLERPVIIMGFSGGALGAPAVAARLMESSSCTVGAAVLVGGGADLMRILQTSVLFRSTPAVRFTAGAAAPEVLDALSRAYLARSVMDPVHTVGALAAVPVLQIHAASDAIVPAATGDLLYERLGRPERWTLPVGHELLFWRLPAYAGEIADWAEAAVGDRRARGSPARAPSGG